MTTTIEPSSIPDARLVELCVQGDTGAFRMVVERYQSLVCALTYAGCGDVHRSEDLAQETFLQAWKHLGDLKEPSRLRAWLCAICRNVIYSALRKEGRAPAMARQPEDETPDDSAPTPPQDAISHEEQTLLWDALEKLPAEYREPLVMYYRQEESVAAVAVALEISEPTARQRLSRGRAMLAQRIEHIIGRGLRASGPTKAFTIAVISVISGVTVSAGVASASAAVVSSAVVKGGASAKAAASTGLLASTLLGPIVGLLGAYLGYRVGLDQTITNDERRYIRRFFLRTIILVAGFLAVFLGSMWLMHWLAMDPVVMAAVTISITVAYAGLLVTLCVKYARRIRQLRAQAVADNPQMLAKARDMSARWNIVYRSRWTLLGLPLIHVNMGSTPDARAAVAKGWIAMGGKAYGVLFACGGMAVGAVSFGGFSVGLLTWGGFALGAITWGGFAVGIWSMGGLAVGWMAVGGCAIAWSAAAGGIAVAREFANGAVAVAAHANDAAAEAFLGGHWFFRLAQGFLVHAAGWVCLLALIPLVPIMVRWRAFREASRKRP